MKPSIPMELVEALKTLRAEQSRKFDAYKAKVYNIWACARKHIEAKHVRH
jgi:hypothetical protein